jgi:hypothetical protein
MPFFIFRPHVFTGDKQKPCSKNRFRAFGVRSIIAVAMRDAASRCLLGHLADTTTITTVAHSGSNGTHKEQDKREKQKSV